MYAWVVWERVEDSQDAHTHWVDGVVLQWKLSAFLLHSVWVKIFLGLFNFLDTQANPYGYISCLHVDRGHATHAVYVALPLGNNLHPVYFRRQVMPPMQIIQQFCWGTTGVLFILGNRCSFCYATHATYPTCQRNLPVNIQHFCNDIISNDWQTLP